MAKESGSINILNPAPASELSKDFFDLVDYFTPNETEAEFYTGIKINDENDAKENAKKNPCTVCMPSRRTHASLDLCTNCWFAYDCKSIPRVPPRLSCAYQGPTCISSAAKRRSRHRALSKRGAFYELGVLRLLQASIQFV